MLNICLFPIRQANAFIPLAIGYAVDVAAPIAIRYLASDLAISAIAKAVQASNAYYSATATLSKAKFLKYFKGKLGLGVAAFVAVADAIGLYISNDGSFYEKSNQGSELGVAEKGYYWHESIGESESASGLMSILLSHYSELHSDLQLSATLEAFKENSLYVRLWANNSGKSVFYRQIRIFRAACDKNGADVASCKTDYSGSTNTDKKVTDSDANSKIMDYVSSMSQSKQMELLSNSDGTFDEEIVDDLVVDNPPSMPNGKDSLPKIGDNKWSEANSIAEGIGQSNDSTASGYVPSSDWDDAYYLANSVANGNSTITGLNAGNIAHRDSDISDPISYENIDLSGIENRLDKQNSISQDISDGISMLNNTNVSIKNHPDSGNSSSFWDKKYPDGISGVLDDFIKKMKSTEIISWLNGFVTNFSGGKIPTYEYCAVLVGLDFGCYQLTLDSSVISVVRIFMIITSILYARRIVFGG